jgi:amidase
MSETFILEEATIADIHTAYRSDTTTARQVVQGYLDRIAAYEKRGPAINAIVTVNDHALEDADRLDRELRETGRLSGPLHGIPVVVKDQVETQGLRTTFGSITAADYIPDNDATAIIKLKDAGAIILAKTTMPDFATSWFSFSSISGETKNPYDLNRDPGGSSSGTAAAVAANFGTVGIGEDTGGSIRLPCSFNSLVGVRVTPGLISRHGMSPLVVFQDTAGPIARTVTDAALVLDALVGYDPKDEYTTAYTVARHRGSYADGLSADGLRGARIGVLRAVLGSDEDPDAAAVNEVFHAAVKSLGEAGAEVIDPVTIPDLGHFIEYTSLYITHSKHDINAFLQKRLGLPFHSVRKIFEAKKFHPNLDLFVAVADGPDQPTDDPEYFPKYAARERFQRAVVKVMAEHNLDAICFPDVQVPAPTKDDIHSDRWTTLTFPTNTLIASQAWMPAISLPAGYTDTGLPVGLEMLTLPFDEASLFRLGYAFEQHTKHRHAPDAVPPLS